MNGRVWLITGATSGFGRALAEAAIADGDVVVAAVRRPEALGDLTGRVSPVRLDVTDLSAMPAAVDQVFQQHGRVDVLVNNAGRGHLGAVEETTDNELRQLMDLHFFGPAELTRLILPSMRRQRSGAIVQMSSMGGRVVFPGVGGYCATKFALEGWSTALSQELKPFGVTVVIVEPGAFRTGFNGGTAIGISDPVADYDDQIAPLRDSFATADGRQPGDPNKAAHAIIAALADGEPPLHLVLGSDAIELVQTSLSAQTAELTEWAHLSRSTNFVG